MSLLPSSNLTQVLEEVISSKLVNVHTCLPAVIESFNPTNQLCSVKIQIKRKIKLQDGSIVSRDIPVLADLPLIFLNVKNFAITLPVQSGDECLVFFSERDIDNWHASGKVSDPRTARRFDFSDGFVLTGVTSTPKKLDSYSATDLEIRMKNNQSKIILKESGDITLENETKITLKSPQIILDGETEVTKTLKVDEDITADGDVTAGSISLQNHVHGGVQSGGSNTGPPS